MVSRLAPGSCAATWSVEIDLRQRRLRQERKGRNAGNRQRHHQQRGRDGAADEWSGDVMRSNRALVRNLPEN
jgi:hypothetical protein